MVVIKVYAGKQMGEDWYSLYLEFPQLKLPVKYEIEDLETLEKNGVLNNKTSCFDGTYLKFDLTKELSRKIADSVGNVITEIKGED